MNRLCRKRWCCARNDFCHTTFPQNGSSTSSSQGDRVRCKPWNWQPQHKTVIGRRSPKFPSFTTPKPEYFALKSHPKAVASPLKDRESIYRYGLLASSRSAAAAAQSLRMYLGGRALGFILTLAQLAAKHPSAAHAKWPVDSFSRVFSAICVQGARSQSVRQAVSLCDQIAGCLQVKSWVDVASYIEANSFAKRRLIQRCWRGLKVAPVTLSKPQCTCKSESVCRDEQRSISTIFL